MIEVVDEVYVIEEEILGHLPHLHASLSVHTSDQQPIAEIGVSFDDGAPCDILDVGLLVHLMGEDQLGRSILEVVSGLLLTRLVVIPNEDLAIPRGRHEEVLTVGRPLNLADGVLVVNEVVDEVLWHPLVPDIDVACGLTTRRKEMLIKVIEADHQIVIIRSFGLDDASRLTFDESQIPQFECAVVACRAEEVVIDCREL